MQLTMLSPRYSRRSLWSAPWERWVRDRRSSSASRKTCPILPLTKSGSTAAGMRSAVALPGRRRPEFHAGAQVVKQRHTHRILGAEHDARSILVDLDVVVRNGLDVVHAGTGVECAVDLAARCGLQRRLRRHYAENLLDRVKLRVGRTDLESQQ